MSTFKSFFQTLLTEHGPMLVRKDNDTGAGKPSVVCSVAISSNVVLDMTMTYNTEDQRDKAYDAISTDPERQEDIVTELLAVAKAFGVKS